MAQNSVKADGGPGGARGAEGLRVFVMVAIAAAVIVLGWLWLANRSSGIEGDAPPATAETGQSQPAAGGAAQPQTAAVSRELIAKIAGRWLRPDGGYIVNILGGDSSGELQVEYFNPRPINVSQAAAVETPQGLQVFIELRDVGYPGATYTLVYDERRDVLEGLYYQPAVGQTFDVVFIRDPGSER